MTPRRPAIRSLTARTVFLLDDLPDHVRQGLVWAPDLATLDDPISGIRGTADGSTYVLDAEYRSFDGVTNRLDWANVRDFGTVPAPSSGAMWIYPTSVGAGVFNIWTASAAPSSQSVIFRRNVDALEFSHASSATPQRTISAAGGLVVNTWYHVGYTYDASGLSAGGRIYINGVETAYQAGANQTGTPRGASGIWALGGRVEADTNNFAGRIRGPMIWDRVLSAAEMASLAGLPRPA